MSYRDVFGEVLADHHESPRNWGKIENPSQVEKGYNPLCGDQVSICLKLAFKNIDQFTLEFF